MRLSYYQEEAAKTAKESIATDLSYLGLGLVGEAGEVAEKLKKNIRDGVLNKRELAKELGDVLWYISNLSLAVGYTLDEVARMNLNKLSSRQSRGVLGGNGDNR